MKRKKNAVKEQKKSNRNRNECRKTKLELIENYGHVCFICGRDVGKAITHHHIIPCSKGGSDYYENGSLTCSCCHSEIHLFEYGSIEYTEFTKRLIKYKEDNLN